MRALRGIDLDVAAGELVMLVGPSGCGKTTLLSILAGVLDADGGSCDVLGQNLAGQTETARAAFRREQVGFVFQEFNLIPALTVTENVSIPLLLQGVPRGDAEARANRILAAVGLAERSGALPAQLSGGQQQRVAIARSLVHTPRLLICDEPTSQLDHDTGEAVMSLLREVAATPDRAIVVVTHDPRILHFADRIVRMEDGRLVDDSAVAEVGG